VTSSTSQIESYLDEVGPYEFESLVAEVWEELEYRTEVTSGSQDRGIDVIAEQDSPVKQKMLIQAKAYTEGNTIGSDEVRKYATLYQQEDDADRVVLVTTSGFTSQAKKLAQDLDVDAIDREDLVEIILDSGFDIGTRFEHQNQNSNSTSKSSTDPVEINRQSNQSKKSRDDDIKISPKVVLPLIGLLVVLIGFISLLSDSGIVSDAFAGFTTIITFVVFIVTFYVIGWLKRNGWIDPGWIDP
jgi:hypothetical protein